ncbi:MAG: hypothetical protein AAGI50_06015 [Pseudomonadota bacterium]
MKIGPYRINIKVSSENPNWWLRPASKASTVGAYILVALSLLLHLF